MQHLSLTIPLYMLVLFLNCSAGFYASIPITRFILRCHPINPSNDKRIKNIIRQIFDAASSVTAVWLMELIVLHRLTAPSLVSEAVTFPSPQQPFETLSLHVFRQLSLGFPLVILCIVPIITCVRRHTASDRFLDYPFILFLRRFSSFGDLSVVIPILRGSPNGIPVVLLIEVNQEVDPLVIGFEGFKFFHPFKSMPLFVKAKHFEWEALVATLIERAGCILLKDKQDG